MEQLQHRPRITALWDRRMVPSRGHTLAMESFQTEFSSVGSRQTSVTPQTYSFADTDVRIVYIFVAGSGKSVLWYFNSLIT
jgi:hypothetical protein